MSRWRAFRVYLLRVAASVLGTPLIPLSDEYEVEVVVRKRPIGKEWFDIIKAGAAMEDVLEKKSVAELELEIKGLRTSLAAALEGKAPKSKEEGR